LAIAFGTLVVNASPAFAACVTPVSGKWNGTTSSTMGFGPGTWNANVTFNPAGGGAWNVSGTIHSQSASGTLDGTLGGFIACDGTISITDTAGTAEVSFSSGTLTNAQTVSGAYQLTNNSIVTDAGTFDGTYSTPVITSLSTQVGPASGGTTVIIQGTNVSNVTSVTFGGAPAVFTQLNAVQISATSPPGTGTVDIIVTVPYGTDGTSNGISADTFIYTGQYSQAVLADGATFYYPLGDAGTTYAADAGPEQLNGTYKCPSGEGQAGAIVGDPGTSTAFNADGCYMNMPAFRTSMDGSFTAEAWVNPTGSITKKWREVFSSRWPLSEFLNGWGGDYSFDFKLTGTTAPGGQQLWADVGTDQYWMFNGGVPFSWQPGHWYDIALVDDKPTGKLTFYVNGQSIGSVTTIIDDPLVFGAYDPIAIGDDPRYALTGSADPEYFGGRIDEAALYGHELTATQLHNHYVLGSQGAGFTASLASSAQNLHAVGSVPEAALSAGDVESGAAPNSAGNAASAPLRSIPLSTSAIGSVPLRSIPLRSISLLANPTIAHALSSVLLSNLPITFPTGCSGTSCTGWTGLLANTKFALSDGSTVPLQSVTLNDVLADPTASARLDALPLSALDLSSSPLRSIPLAAIALAGVPLRSIPLPGTTTADSDTTRLNAWCTLLQTLGSNCNTAFGIDPNNPARSDDVDLLALSLGGVDVDSVPLRSIPLRSIDLSTSPLRSIPLRSIDVENTPLRSIPLRSIPLRSIAVGGLPLGSVPSGLIGSIVDCTAVSQAGLNCATTTLAAVQQTAPNAISSAATLETLKGVLDSMPLRSIPLRSIDVTSTPLRSIPLRSIYVSTSPLRSIPLTSITLSSTPLRSIPLRSIPLVGNVVNCISSSIDCTSAATLGDAEAAKAILPGATLDMLSSLDSAPLRSILLQSVVLSGSPLRSIPLRSIDLVSSVVDCLLVDCSATTTATLGDAADKGAIRNTATLDQLGQFLGTALGDVAASSQFNMTFGDLGAYLGSTLGDLLPALGSTPDTFTLSDLLLGLMDPTSYPWQDVNVASLPLASAGTGASTTTLTSTLSWAGASSEPTQALLTLPSSLAYVPGTSQFDGTPIGEPGNASGSLYWSLNIAPGTHTLSVQTSAVAGLGPATASLALEPAGQSTVVTSIAVNVTDPTEPNGTASSPGTLSSGQLAISYLNSPNDSDWWQINVGEGDELALSLSNLPADYDMALFAPLTTPLQAAPPVTAPSVSDASPTLSSTAQPPAGGNEVDVTPPSGYALEALSANRGTNSEAIQTPPLDPGTYLVHITGFNGAYSTSPYMLRAQLLSSPAHSCPALYPSLPSSLIASAPSLSSLPSNLNTIFLVNTQRLAAAYGTNPSNPNDPNSATGVLTNLNNLISNASGGVVGAVIPVDDYSAVIGAYQAWDQNPCSISGANGVVQAMAVVVNNIRAARPSLKNVVIVGGDDQVPFARVADGTVQSNERDYGASTFPGEENVLADTLSAGYYLSDDPLTASQPLSVGSATLYVPQLALGRLVETPAEINAELSQYITSGGKIGASSALSTGYSFLDGGAQAVAVNLAKAPGRSIHTLLDTTTPNWTHQQLDDALLANPQPGIDSVNAHFDFSRALPSAGDVSGDQTDLFTTSDIANHASSFTGRLLFSMGCHAGLEMNTAELAASSVSSDDWAKEFASSGAVWVANTGYGYADSDTLSYSARLMAGFADELDGNVSVGAALLNAKQNYSAGNALLSPYDIKALMESTFYGLPMYQLNNTPPTPPTLPQPPSTFTDTATGLTAANVSAGTNPLTFDAVTPTGGNGTFYEVHEINPQLQVTEFRPIEPLKSIDVTEPGGLVAHGAFIEAQHSSDTPLANPAVSEPGVDSASNTVSTTAGDPFPATPTRVATYQTVDASGTTSQRQRLDLILGQFLPGATPQQRLFDSLTAEILYTPSSNTNFTAPTIGTTDGYVLNGQLHFDAAISNSSAAVKRVNVLYTDADNPGTWTSLDLSPIDSTHFAATTTPTASGHIAYVVQAVDAAGNVGVATNKGSSFPAVAPPSPPVVTSGAYASFVEGASGSFVVQVGGNPMPTVGLTGSLPAGLTFDPSTNTIAGTPAPGSAGTYSLRVTAGTATAQTQQVLTLFVAGANGYGAKPFVFTEPVSVVMPSSSATQIDVPVALSWPSAVAVSVTYQTLNKTALAGADYEAASGVATFAPGQTLALIPVTVDTDSQAGLNLTFTVKLSLPVGGTVSAPMSTVTLINSQGPMTVSIDNQLTQPANGGGTMTFNIALSSPVAAGHTVTVPYLTVDGSAHAGIDYTSTSGQLSFTAGQSVQQVPVPILDGPIARTARTFSLKLGKVPGATVAIPKGVGTIAPIGPLPKPLAVVLPVAALMPSQQTVVNVPVALSWPAIAPVSMSFETVNKTAVAGIDYESTSGRLTFAPGQTLAQIPVTIDPDTQGGANLSFSVKLLLQTGVTLAASVATVTLVNPLGPETLSVSDPAFVPAPIGNDMPFIVSLASPVSVGHSVTVPYLTGDGSAHAGIDYSSTVGTLTFLPGQSAEEVVVPLLDSVVIKSKTFSLKLGKPVGATVAINKGTGTIAP
jgi:hypothetical protein